MCMDHSKAWIHLGDYYVKRFLLISLWLNFARKSFKVITFSSQDDFCLRIWHCEGNTIQYVVNILKEKCNFQQTLMDPYR